MDDCIGFLPTKTRDQINDHEKWYRQFLSISNKRRLALKKWREEKNVSLSLIDIFLSHLFISSKRKRKSYMKLNKLTIL